MISLLLPFVSRVDLSINRLLEYLLQYSPVDRRRLESTNYTVGYSSMDSDIKKTPST